MNEGSFVFGLALGAEKKEVSVFASLGPVVVDGGLTDVVPSFFTTGFEDVAVPTAGFFAGGTLARLRIVIVQLRIGCEVELLKSSRF